MRAPSRRPTHSVSGCSWSKATLAARAVDLRARGGSCGRARPARRRRWRARRGRSAAARRRRPRSSAAGRRAAGTVVSVALSTAREAVPADEGGEVAPVRADVGEGARAAAEGGVDAPVGVARRQQPVLQVGAVDAADVAELAGGDQLARVADDGVVAVDERDRDEAAGVGGVARELLGLGAVERDRLLADDVLAVLERELGQRRVQVVRRADVQHVDVVGGRQLLGGRGGALGAELDERPARRAAASRRRRRRASRRPAAPSGRGCCRSCRCPRPRSAAAGFSPSMARHTLTYVECRQEF